MKYYLSTDGYYFVYRKDYYDHSIIRCTLFDKDENIVDDVKLGLKEHSDIINHFEARLQMGIIPDPKLTPIYNEKKQRGMWVLFDDMRNGRDNI